MTLFHFFNCAALAFGPHIVFYKATPLSEYGTWSASLKASLVYLVTMLIKLILWATLLKAGEEAVPGEVPSADELVPFDMHQEVLKAVIGMLDGAGLFYALTQLSLRNISSSHKFQSIGLGWALSESLSQRLLPLWVGAGGMEFKWDYIFTALESNSALILTISLAALGSLMWLRKNKPPVLIPFIYATAAFIVSMPFITSYLQRGLLWNVVEVVGFQLSAAFLSALVTWRLFVACQKPSL